MNIQVDDGRGFESVELSDTFERQEETWEARRVPNGWMRAYLRPIVLLSNGFSPAAFTESIVGTLLQVDVGLILSTWKIKGVMVCTRDGRPNACLLIENAYPCGIIEVVRQPGRSHLLEASLLKLLEPLGNFGVLYGKSSSHTVESDQGSHLQFAEAHVYTFVPPLLGVPAIGGLPIVHPLGPLFQVSYFSEIDGFNWRTAFADYVLDPEAAAKRLALPSCESVPRVEDCAGKWGSWFPRIGFLNHPSEVMAAYMQALRAGRAAARRMPA